jgi:hypothetical protein
VVLYITGGHPVKEKDFAEAMWGEIQMVFQVAGLGGHHGDSQGWSEYGPRGELRHHHPFISAVAWLQRHFLDWGKIDQIRCEKMAKAGWQSDPRKDTRAFAEEWWRYNDRVKQGVDLRLKEESLEPDRTALGLTVFHNPGADVPLPDSVFVGHFDKHLRFPCGDSQVKGPAGRSGTD